MGIYEKKDILEWICALGAAVFDRVKSYHQDHSRTLFIATRELINESRRTLSNLSLEYYERAGLKNGIANFPLITKREWIMDKLVEKDIIELCWDSKGNDCTFFSHDSFPLKSTYATNVKDLFPKIYLENNYSYRLRRIYWRSDKLALFFCPSNYYDFYNTCEVLSYEFAFPILRKCEDVGLTNGPLDIVNQNYELRAQTKVFELSNRGAIPGINTLLIYLNRNQNGLNYFYLHNRNSPQLAEAANTHHVVPAGTFQPDGYYDNYHERDFSLVRNIMREFAEELLGKNELSQLIKDEKDFMDERPIKALSNLIEKGHAKIYFLGIGIDPLNTKPEILTCMVIDGNRLGKRAPIRFKNNFEGEHFSVPLDKEHLDKFIVDKKTLPACAACLILIKSLFNDLII